jgi:hypothetical protein
MPGTRLRFHGCMPLEEIGFPSMFNFFIL